MAEKVSFVIPCYCSEKTIRSVVDEIRGEIKKQETKIDFEIILVNDFSKDNTLEEIRKLSEEDDHIVALGLSRNFGQASAMMAGFHECQGDVIVSLDDDGQMPIESVFGMIDELEKGYDVVFGKYDEIKQKWYRNFGSWVNVKMAETLLGQPKHVRMTSFWVAKRYIIEKMIEYDGAYPYIGGLMLRITKNISSFPVKHRERQYGNSGYTFAKLIALWMNGFTAFSILPLRVATFFGLICAAIGFCYGVITVIRKLMNPEMMMGYASIITIMLFIGGGIMMMLGIIGEYVGRTYININKAPQFLVKQRWDYRK